MTILNEAKPAVIEKRFEPLTSMTVPKTIKPEKIFSIPRKDVPANAGVSTVVEYVNYTKSAIYIKSQNGTVIAVMPATDDAQARKTDRHLEIRVTTMLNRSDCVKRTTDVLSAHKEEQKTYPMSAESSVFLEGLLNEQMREGFSRAISGFSQTNVLIVDYRQLVNIEALYVREVDALVSIHGSVARVPHPNNSEGMAALDVGRLVPSPGQVGMIVKAIDNEGYVDRRFMFSGKEVITIPAYEDPSMESGVYITTMNSGPDGDIKRTTTRYSYEEAETQHGIYRTKEQALTNGDPQKKLEHDTALLKSSTVVKKIEEVESSHDLKMLEKKVDAFMLQLKQEREVKHALTVDELREKQLLTERIKQLEKEALEHEAIVRKDHYERRSKERDDYYDRRSSSRKDSSEAIKWVPAIVTGMFAAFAIINYQTRGEKLY